MSIGIGINFECQRNEQEDPLPTYRDSGRILVHVTATDSRVYRFDYEVIAFDSDASPYWIQEGEGFSYWCDNVDEITGPGLWLIEDIEGSYLRGDGWTTDDDVEWYWGAVRRITKAEAMELDGFALTEDELEDVE
jgi:hypothetical protein